MSRTKESKLERYERLARTLADKALDESLPSELRVYFASLALTYDRRAQKEISDEPTQANYYYGIPLDE
jgi:hypothetical protein